MHVEYTQLTLLLVIVMASAPLTGARALGEAVLSHSNLVESRRAGMASDGIRMVTKRAVIGHQDESILLERDGEEENVASRPVSMTPIKDPEAPQRHKGHKGHKGHKTSQKPKAEADGDKIHAKQVIANEGEVHGDKKRGLLLGNIIGAKMAMLGLGGVPVYGGGMPIYGGCPGCVRGVGMGAGGGGGGGGGGEAAFGGGGGGGGGGGAGR